MNDDNYLSNPAVANLEILSETDAFKKDARRKVLLPGWKRMDPNTSLTPIDEVPEVVAEGENWTQYSDGETAVYAKDGIITYLE